MTSTTKHQTRVGFAIGSRGGCSRGMSRGASACRMRPPWRPSTTSRGAEAQHATCAAARRGDARDDHLNATRSYVAHNGSCAVHITVRVSSKETCRQTCWSENRATCASCGRIQAARTGDSPHAYPHGVAGANDHENPWHNSATLSRDQQLLERGGTGKCDVDGFCCIETKVK